MKKFTKILICLMLCVFGIGLVACDDRTAKEKAFTYPSASAELVGNGGLSVRKGNYIYFVNGYKSVADLKNSNKNNSHTVGSLMLMKLDENGEIVTDENGLVKDSYYITMSSRLCGYEATDLFIHGSYLYFVSPILENESGKGEVWAKERVVFYRIKLDKTSKVEEVYRSNVKFDSLEYKYYESGSNLYVLAWEKGNAYYDGSNKDALIKINATSKTSSLISQKVSSVVFADKLSDVFYVYYDKNVQDNKTVYDVKRYNVKDPIMNDIQNKPTLSFVSDGKLYATQAHENDSSITNLVVANVSAGANDFNLFISNVGEYDVSITPEGAAVVLTQDNFIYLVDANQTYDVDSGAEITIAIEEDESVTAIDVIDFTNGCVLYLATTSENSIIKMFSYSTAIFENVYEISTLTSMEVLEEDYKYFDLNEDESCLYFYKIAGKSESEYYLHRLNIDNGEAEEMVGVYKSGDAPEVEETEDEEIEEE